MSKPPETVHISPIHAADTQADVAASTLESDLSATTEALIHSRQNISPKRLTEPGPSPRQLAQLFDAAAAAPDHGLLRPWRFIIIPQDRRALLAEVFALALVDRDPDAAPSQIEQAREKAHRAPLLMLAVAQLGPVEPDIPALERMLSLGCAIQNMLLLARGMGFGAGLTSGQAIRSARMRTLFSLAEGEQPACFINIGTESKHKPQRPRPGPGEFVSTL